MATVPVTPLGTGLTPSDAPSGKPMGPTGAPGTVPSEEVTPSGGKAVGTWANAGLQYNKGNAVATISNGLIEGSPIPAEGLRGERQQAAVSKAAEATIFFFMAATDTPASAPGPWLR